MEDVQDSVEEKTPSFGEEVKEILMTLALAFDNLIEANSVTKPAVFSNTTVASNNGLATTGFSSFSHSHSQSSSPSPSPSPQSPSRAARVRKFQRPSSRRMTMTATSQWASERKRSASFTDSPDDCGSEHSVVNSFAAEHFGKRSKSVVLIQELEGLRVTSPPSEFDFWFPDGGHGFDSVSSTASELVTDASVLISELESLERFDKVLKALGSMKSIFFSNQGPGASSSLLLTNWAKWRLINRAVQETTYMAMTSQSSKATLNRWMAVSKSLNSLAPHLNWSDPELIFLILVLMTRFLQTYAMAPTTHGPRRLEEFLAGSRVLSSIIQSLHRHASAPAFSFLLAQASLHPKLLELLELFLESTLNLFELSTSMASNSLQDARQEFWGLKVAFGFTFLFLKTVELVNPTTECRNLLAKLSDCGL